MGMLQGPEVPVGHIAIETFVELIGVEALLPCVVQTDEVVEMDLRTATGATGRSVSRRARGAGRQADVLDERDLALQHVAGIITLVKAAPDDGQRESVACRKRSMAGMGKRRLTRG